MTKSKRKRIQITEWQIQRSPSVLDRLRLMYTFDIITRYHNGSGKIGDLLFDDELNPDWLKEQDNFKHMTRAFSKYMMDNLKSEGDELTWGAWKIRRTKNSLLVEAPIARIPLKSLKKVSYRMEIPR